MMQGAIDSRVHPAVSYQLSRRIRGIWDGCRRNGKLDGTWTSVRVQWPTAMPGEEHTNGKM